MIFLGPPGVGKTHLAISLAIAAAQSGRRVYYGTLADLITSLEEAQAAGRLHDPTESPAELQRQAMAWIADHPGTFARRMLGRLARVFVPKTDVLELAGGEARAGIFSPLPLALLAVANLQWVVILAGGAAGLLAIRRLSPETGWLLLATVAGALVLCLVAISKPRYSFPFDPLLIIGVAAVSAAPRVMLPALSQGDRRALVAAAAFVAWAWIAWLVFAFTSRAAL